MVLPAALALAGCGNGGNQAQKPAGTTPGTTTPTTTQPKQATVNANKVEATLKRSFRGLSAPALPATIYPRGGGAPQQSQYGGGRIKVRSVTCPDGVPLQKGRSFSCQVDVAKGTGGVRLTQLDGSGSKMRFKATFKSEVMTGVTATTRIRGQIKITP